MINLRRRPDRRARMERLLPSGLDVVFTSDWDGPFDGRDLDREAVRGFGIFPGWRVESRNGFWSRPMKKGEVALAISHWRCWQDASARDVDQAVVFEDDVTLADAFVATLTRTLQVLADRHADWDLLYLGRVGHKPTLPAVFLRDIPLGDGLVAPGFSCGAFAYVLSRAGLRKLLGTGFDQALIPVDEFLPAMFILHPRPDVAGRFRAQLKAFALKPSIAFQADLGSDTEASGLVDWME